MLEMSLLQREIPPSECDVAVRGLSIGPRVFVVGPWKAFLPVEREETDQVVSEAR
jgi:hypothetical protein